jgi:hypothetical protein
MALFSSRLELTDAVKHETERAMSPKFDAALPRFVALAEQRMFYGSGESEPLRLRIMETAATIEFDDGAGEMPADYLAARALRYTEGDPKTEPKYQPPEVFWSDRYAFNTGSPVAYTIEGDDIYISPAISGNLTFLYYALPAALDSDTATNDVLEKHPMLYFHATLFEAYSWLRNTERAETALANYASASSGLLRSERRARQGGNALAMRIPNWRVR